MNDSTSHICVVDLLRYYAKLRNNAQLFFIMYCALLREVNVPLIYLQINCNVLMTLFCLALSVKPTPEPVLNLPSLALDGQ